MLTYNTCKSLLISILIILVAMSPLEEIIGNSIIATVVAGLFSLHNNNSLPIAFATSYRVILRSIQHVYSATEPLVVYGTDQPNDVLIVRLYEPGGRAIKMDSIPVDRNGFYRKEIFDWPAPSRNLPFGTYTVEVIPSNGDKTPIQMQVEFAEGAQGNSATESQNSVTHILSAKLDSPAQVTVSKQFRIFVQVTFDGVLVDSGTPEDTAKLLGYSHIHSDKGYNSTISLSDKFTELHEGLYYADVTINTEGTYIVHSVAFYKGFLSHDSKVITVSASSISTVQDTVDDLGRKLNATNQELANVQNGLDRTKAALNDTRVGITDSVNEAHSSLRDDLNKVEEASGQINSIILPVLALISVIIALQISLFARIRASYR
jgi:hypothetical protein